MFVYYNICIFVCIYEHILIILYYTYHTHVCCTNYVLYTCIHVIGGNIQSVIWLLETHGVPLLDGNSKPFLTATGLSPVAVAALYGRTEILSYLILVSTTFMYIYVVYIVCMYCFTL